MCNSNMSFLPCSCLFLTCADDFRFVIDLAAQLSDSANALPSLCSCSGFHSNDITSIPEGAFHNNPLLRTM